MAARGDASLTYQALETHFRRLARLEHLDAIASWDEAAMMPPGGGAARADALSTLRGLIHDQLSAPHVGELVAQAESELGTLGPWQRANLREIKRVYVRATAVPSALVEAASLAESKSEQAWRTLRASNDWESFRPLLEDVVRLKRQIATARLCPSIRRRSNCSARPRPRTRSPRTPRARRCI
jgi:carboxypeptidase Taq